VLLAGGTDQADSASIWFLDLGPEIFATYPKGSTAGISRAGEGVWWSENYGGTGLRALVHRLELSLGIGVVVTDWRKAVRICNIDVSALGILSYSYVLYAWGMATVQGFTGAGYTITPTWMHFWCFWMFEIPLAWALAYPAGLGAAGVFWSVCVAESALALLGIALFRRGRWKTTQVAADVVPGPA